MVQITVDTSKDSLEELEDALSVLEGALERRKKSKKPALKEEKLEIKPEIKEVRPSSVAEMVADESVELRQATSIKEEKLTEKLTAEKINAAINSAVLEQSVLKTENMMKEAKAASEKVSVAATVAKLDMPAMEPEETVIDTPFIKITSKPEELVAEAAVGKPKMPSLQQLINDESLSDDEIGKIFKAQNAWEEEHKKVVKEQPQEKKEEAKPFIEIIEYTDEK